MKSFLFAGAALFIAVTPALADESKGGGSGTGMSAASGTHDGKRAAPTGDADDSNLSSHKGPDAAGSAEPSAPSIKGATGDVGAAKKNAKHHGGTDTGKTTDSARNGQKNAQAPSQPADSKEH
jgi:hypothetical protein